MSDWTAGELSLFSEARSLVLTAGDGGGPGVEIGMVVAGGELYVRAYRGAGSRWFRAAREHGHGRVRVDGGGFDVRFETDGLGPSSEIDNAYRAKYGRVAHSLVLGVRAQEATIRIEPAPSRAFDGRKRAGRGAQSPLRE
ncbi:DUF2255 family protein [Streptomyces sp. NPDC060184]|uniref:DUF2255 family protein n=1 Tax=Streptomyces sp. NPDC060184 TaxID=3347064 RepID=UPI003666D11A